MGSSSSKEAPTPPRSPRPYYPERSYSYDQPTPTWGSSYSQESSAGHRDYPPPRPASSYGESIPVAYPPPRPYSQPETHAPHQSFSQQAPSYQRPSQTTAAGGQQRKLDRRYSKIADNYRTLDQVTEALAHAGLESSNLIVGVDFTKSNEWTGKFSFNHKSLHHIGDNHNPYEQAISIIGRTLSAFDEDNLIPCFGFGDASTHDQDVFSFYPDERPCNGFTEALARYREIVPHLRLAGPTSFAPMIEMAMTIVEQSGGQYHVLVIIADGQVTRSVDTESSQLSPQEQKTVDAIVKASEYPLSIILVGVGDGPWDMMKEFDDNIPARSFDNFQFVNFTEIMAKNVPQSRKETDFALSALMEIPTQYKATLELGILGHRCGRSPERVALPPPIRNSGPASFGSKTFQSSTSFQQRTSYYPGYEPASSGKSDYPEYNSTFSSAPNYPEFDSTPSTAPPAASASWDNEVCPVCLEKPKDMAFGCGHQTCYECGPNLKTCPICRSEIQTRIKLY